MFFKKKSADKPDPKLEDFADDEHTRSYHFKGNEQDEPPLPELDPPPLQLSGKQVEIKAEESPPSFPEVMAEDAREKTAPLPDPPITLQEMEPSKRKAKTIKESTKQTVKEHPKS